MRRVLSVAASTVGSRGVSRDSGGQRIKTIGVVSLTCAFLAVSVTLIYLLIAIWPAPVPPGELTVPPVKVAILFWEPTLTRDQHFLLLVALAGAFGAMGHVVRSFFQYAGERKLKWNWAPSYFLDPVVGALLGVLIYIVLKAGLISGGGATADPYGFAAIAALAGLFSAETTTKLREVFRTIFSAPEPGADALDSSGPGITGIAPTSGSVGATVALTGGGLNDVTAVTFSGGATSAATYDPDLELLTTTVPAGATSGGLSVTVAGQVVTSTLAFEVTPVSGGAGLGSSPGVGITGIAPTSGPVGASVTLTGDGLDDVTVVTFSGGVTSAATYDPDLELLSTTVPAGATSGALSVTVGGQVVTSATGFEVS
jgi:hypothetical protein